MAHSGFGNEGFDLTPLADSIAVNNCPATDSAKAEMKNLESEMAKIRSRMDELRLSVAGRDCNSKEPSPGPGTSFSTDDIMR